MTKTYEETVRGTLAELLAWSESKEILGEITLVIGGFVRSSHTYSQEDLVGLVAARESAGEARKDAIASIAKELNLPKRQVFDAVVALKNR